MNEIPEYESIEVTPNGTVFHMNIKSAYPEVMTSDAHDQQHINSYYPVTLSCGHEVWGTDADVDSGIRKHKECCDYYINEMDGTESEL